MQWLKDKGRAISPQQLDDKMMQAKGQLSIDRNESHKIIMEKRSLDASHHSDKLLEMGYCVINRF